MLNFSEEQDSVKSLNLLSFGLRCWCTGLAPLCEHLALVMIFYGRRPMMELLLGRLSPELRTLAVKRIARFITRTTLPSVAAEAGIVCDVVGGVVPEEAATLLLKPLLASVEAELPSLRRGAADASGLHISKASLQILAVNVPNGSLLHERCSSR